jgi:anti-sigma factor RsiW
MKCSVSEEQLALYASGDLDCSQSAAVSTHLAVCRGCRSTLADLQLSAKLFAESFADPATEDLLYVRAALNTRLTPQVWRIPFWKPAAMAASVALIALLLFHHPADNRPVVTGSRPTQAPLAQNPSVQPVRLVQHRARRTVNKPGLRSVVFTKNQDGKSELKLATADPNVFILLPTDGNNHAN